MSENEIKPVAWRVTQGRTFVDRAFMDKGQADSSADSRRDGAVVVPLYDQSAIDRLTAERDAAVADAGRWQKWLPWIRGLSRKPFSLAMEIRSIDAARSEGAV